MKKIILSIILLTGLAGAVSAQTLNRHSKNKIITAHKKRGTATTSSTSSQPPGDENRKNIMYKDGQKATPTGHEATGVNAEHAPLKKDTAKRKKGKR